VSRPTRLATDRRKAVWRQLDSGTLDEIIGRVVETTRPDRIILFGSAARGKMGPHSDVDLLVVKSGRYDASRLTGRVYMNLGGIPEAVDIVLVTPEQVERYRRSQSLIIAPALREGRQVYVATPPARRSP
jgi:uncharacterized protein